MQSTQLLNITFYRSTQLLNSSSFHTCMFTSNFDTKFDVYRISTFHNMNAFTMCYEVYKSYIGFYMTK